MRDQQRASASADRAPSSAITTASIAAVAPAHPASVQHKRRTLFLTILAAIFLPALVAAILPNAQAADTVFVAAETDAGPPPSESTTSATAAPTTEAPTTTAAAPTSTAKAKPSTTTTSPPKTTTTTAPKKLSQAAPAPAPAAPAPAPVATAPSSGGASPAEAAFLACVRQRESGGNYSVVSSNGLWFGAYQMTRQTWNSTAQRAGRADLVGVPPNQASPGDQDSLALVLYRWLGKSPWGGAC
jgi:cytoskeletal protein RodZ